MTLAELAPETRNLIDGERVEASDGGRFENVDPATEAVLGTTADGTQGRHGARGRRRASDLR